MNFSKKHVLTNILWRLAERVGAQMVSFVVSVVLARLLLPEDYGVVAIILVFTGIMDIFIDSGFRNALIQKKDADEIDFSTVFFFSIAMGVGLYLLLFLAAPLISYFYERPELIGYMRVLGLTLILGGVNGVQHAYVSKTMQFRRFFFATIGGTVFSAVVGIGMAAAGFGPWALVAQRLINQFCDTVILWYTVKWRPMAAFSLHRLRPLFSYGSKILGSSLISSLTANLSGLLIGKAYSADALAYYNKGQQIPYLLAENLRTSVQSVLFPVLSAEQDDPARIRAILKKTSMMGAYCIFPCMMGLAICARPLVILLYTERWIELVPYLQMWCFIHAFYLVYCANLQVIQALKRSDIFLKLEIIKQVLSLAGLVLAIPFGVLAIMVMLCIHTVFSLYINLAPNKKLVGYGFWDQMKDLLPIMLLNLLMGAFVWLAGLLPLGNFSRLLVQIVVGVVTYYGFSVLFRIPILMECKSLLRQLFRRSGT